MARRNKNKSWAGNIGEWSEPYVVYKLLADGKLCQADENFNPSQNDFLQIISVIRDDVVSERSRKGCVTFKSEAADGSAVSKVVPLRSVRLKAARLFNELLSRKSTKGSFEIPWLENELKKLGFVGHKNPIPLSQKSIKRDVTLKVQDPKSGGQPDLGFSVKSEIGCPPTLLNASDATNIIYRVKGLTSDDAKHINAHSTGNKLIWKCKEIKARATSIEFEKYNNSIFLDNLDVVDAALPRIVADLVKTYYFETLIGPRQRKKGTYRPHDRLTKVLSILNTKEPYCSHSRRNYCEIKVKRFLRACALGLMPSKIWNDIDDANGGYIIVLPNGKLIGFYVYNRKLFEDYLLNETIFERADTKKWKYLELIADGNSGDYLLKLNLDIRFSRR